MNLKKQFAFFLALILPIIGILSSCQNKGEKETEDILVVSSEPDEETQLTHEEKGQKIKLALLGQLVADLSLNEEEGRFFVQTAIEGTDDTDSIKGYWDEDSIPYLLLRRIVVWEDQTGIAEAYFGKADFLGEHFFPIISEVQGMRWYDYLVEYEPSSYLLQKLGSQFLSGKIVTKNIAKGIALYERAIEVYREPRAALTLAGHYESGEILPLDGEKSCEYYLAARDLALEDDEGSRQKSYAELGLAFWGLQGIGPYKYNPQDYFRYNMDLFSNDDVAFYDIFHRLIEVESDPLTAIRMRRALPYYYGGEDNQDHEELIRVWDEGEDPLAEHMKTISAGNEYFPPEMVSDILKEFYTLNFNFFSEGGNIHSLSSNIKAEDLPEELIRDGGSQTYCYQTNYNGVPSIILKETAGSGGYTRYRIYSQDSERPMDVCIEGGSKEGSTVVQWQDCTYFIYHTPFAWGGLGDNWWICYFPPQGEPQVMRLNWQDMIPRQLLYREKSGIQFLQGFVDELEEQISDAIKVTREEEFYISPMVKTWEPVSIEKEGLADIRQNYGDVSYFLSDWDNDGQEEYLFSSTMRLDWSNGVSHGVMVVECPDGVVPEGLQESRLTEFGFDEDSQMRQFWTITDSETGLTYSVVLSSSNIIHKAQVFLNTPENGIQPVRHYIYMEEYQNVDVTFETAPEILSGYPVGA